MGAEVVKIERPGRGDDARAWHRRTGAESATFIALNRNKKSLALDLKSPGGLEVLHRLVGRADVFVQSLRPGAIDELGLDFAGAAGSILESSTARSPRSVHGDRSAICPGTTR